MNIELNISLLHDKIYRFYLIVFLTFFTSSCQATIPPITIKRLGGDQSLIYLGKDKRYLLLPVEEAMPEARIDMIVNNQLAGGMNVRLAREKIDYFVPIELTGLNHKSLVFQMKHIPDSAICWRAIDLSDEYDTSNNEKFRPVYHFTPPYGWMNDPNGMVYKDGTYHLFYQYNPYGSMWGNMHWGHATSQDLTNWKHQPVAIAPDALGAIFSGSCVVDKNNTAGFGKDAIVALYTSAGDRQTQSLAYSLDNGKSFIKYEGNPILSSPKPDFRDPKVIWHEPTKKWIMILAVGQEMQFFSSGNLKEWVYESSFGEGQGAHGGVWECPDLIELPIDGTDNKKWVLLCNLNPGGPFGGSATQYFVGSFDGKSFINQSPNLTKWMDWGKDHYATVTWSNAPDNRYIAIAWMSNWQYANDVPTKQFRSANSVPRDLSLYVQDGECYLKNQPSQELLALRTQSSEKYSFGVNRDYNIDSILGGDTGTYEMEVTIKNKDAEFIGFKLFNTLGEEVDIYYNLIDKSLSMDRTKSGEVSFSKDFPAVTTAPIQPNAEMKLRIFVDKSSIEIFGDDGRFVMTNLVFPNQPYNRINFYSKGGSYHVDSLQIHKLELANEPY